MADSTHFDNERKPDVANSAFSPSEELNGLSERNNLTWLNKEQMLLIWTAPDIRLLAQRIISGDTIKLIQPTLSASPTSILIRRSRVDKEDPFYREVFAYLHDVKRWGGNTPGALAEIKVSQLPPALHDEAVARIQAALLKPTNFSIWKAWFSDDFWNEARLQVIEQSNGQPDGHTQVVTIGSSFRLGSGVAGSMMSLGALPRRNKQ